jgi:N-acetylmuramic acid 6-phosphate (MurNAc-6-P) etherase
MTPSTPTPRVTTAIPPRYGTAREGVLRILARWEESTRRAMRGAEWSRVAAEQPCEC